MMSISQPLISQPLISQPLIAQILLPLAASLLGWSPVSMETSTDGTHPMTGHWQLNEELSENPRDRLRAGRGGAAGRLGGRGGGAGGFGRGQRARGVEGRQRGGSGPARELILSVSSQTFTITAGERPQQTYVVDDEVADEVAAGVAAVVGDGFVVRSETPRGGVVTREFALAKKGQRLKIQTTLPGRGGGQGIVFTTVYDRVDED